MKVDFSKLTIRSAHDLLQNGKLSARELLRSCIGNIKKNEINSFLEIFDDAYEKAERVDRKISEGQKISLLSGIPMAVKDNILIKGKRCSAGSKILENYTAPYSATAIEKLEKEGVVFVGRTNMDEFAMGSSSEYSAFGPTKNPYDKERVAGGSSGGSAAAVAADECLTALGSDTGGSIRQPASFCGVVGMKPTYGAVSRSGLIATASSLDQIGPIAKTVEDAEIIFNAVKGVDPLDLTTSQGPTLGSFPRSDLGIGVPKEFFSMSGKNRGISESVISSTKKALEVFQKIGFKIKEVSIPSLEYATEVYYIIMAAEVSSNLARYDGIRYGISKEGFGKEVRRRILLGTYVLSSGYYDAYYGRAQKVKNLIKNDFKKVFNEVDIILSPTTPTPAFKIGEKTTDPVEMYLADIFTNAANLTGTPAISMPASQRGEPCGLDDGLPLGLQLMSSWFEEEKLFYIAKQFENENVSR